MKVQCGQCPAKYAVSDERVRDRKVRIHCKRCGASIIVDGKVDPPLITSTPARPSVRPPTPLVPAPEPPPQPDPDPESQPAPRPVAHTIMGGLEAPAAERLQQQREAPLARPLRSPASPFEAHDADSLSHMPAEHRGMTEPPLGADEHRWRVALTKQDLRWMTTNEIVEAFRSGAVKHETFVFRAGMPTWVTLPEVPEIAAALAAAVGNGELSASALPPQRSPSSSRPPPRRAPAGLSSASEAAFASLAEVDSAEPLPFALVAERSNGATAAYAAAEDARHFPDEPPHRADEDPADAFEPPAPERPSIERLSVEAMQVDHLSHIPDEPEPFAPPPFAAAQQTSGSSTWIWVVVGLLVLAAAAAFMASRLGVKLF